jgi:hypothetical protein
MFLGVVDLGIEAVKHRENRPLFYPHFVCLDSSAARKARCRETGRRVLMSHSVATREPVSLRLHNGAPCLIPRLVYVCIPHSSPATV